MTRPFRSARTIPRTLSEKLRSVVDFEVPYHVDIMESFDGIDLDAARRTSGNGFYYLKGDIARLHSSILSYARDFMIDRGFTYYIPRS